MPNLSAPGTRVTPIPKGIASRVGDAVRYVITGVTPATWFGPMQPLAPMAPEGTAGRAFDYPTGYNLQYQPRAEEPLTFETLRALADGCDMLRLVIETRKDQIEAQDWDVRPRKLSDGSHPRASEFATEIAAAKDFFASPDRRQDFAGWVRAVAEELFVIDAVSIYLRPDRAGRVSGFELVDGSTISPRIDAWGRTPAAPDVAYQQILHGIPAADFSTEQLIYFPRNRRPGHVYGYSPVEQVIATANTLVRRSAHQLSFYTDGNLVDGLFVAPPTWTNVQVSEWQTFWDAQFAGNLPQRRHGIWVPGNVDFKTLKQPELKDAFDEFLARIICYAFSISPQPFVSMMNRATAESAHDSAVEEGLIPVLNYFRRLFRIMFDRMGWRDIEMVPVDDRETDPKTADDIDVADVKAGIRTINEVRTSRGLDPLPGGDALMVATGSGYVPVADAGAPQPASTKSRSPGDVQGFLRKVWESDEYPRWPTGAPDSQGGQFAPKGEGAVETQGESDKTNIVLSEAFPTNMSGHDRPEQTLRWLDPIHSASHAEDASPEDIRQEIQSQFASRKGGDYWIDPKSYGFESAIDIGQQIDDSINNPKGYMHGVFEQAAASGQTVSFDTASWRPQHNAIRFQNSLVYGDTVGRVAGTIDDGQLTVGKDGSYTATGTIILTHTGTYDWTPDGENRLKDAVIDFVGRLPYFVDGHAQPYSDGSPITLQFTRRLRFTVHGKYALRDSG